MSDQAVISSETNAAAQALAEIDPKRAYQRVVRDLINVTKPGITMSNAMMTFVGIWLGAMRHPVFSTAMLTLAGSSLVVMGGCAMNNFMDRDIDQLMSRTMKRPLPNNRLPAWSVIALGSVLAALGILMLGLYVNGLSALMAFIGLFFYVIVYTRLTKRTTSLSTVIGSISGAMPPLIGWTAMSNSLSLSAFLLFAFMFIWQPPHFFALGMRRVKEYAAAGIPLVPVLYGFDATKRQMVFWTVLLLPVSTLLYFTHAVGMIYLATSVVLGLWWIVKAVRGYRATDDVAWATEMFKFSLIYLMVMAAAMVISAV
ncbi:heme o synthase [Ferroacidibacillus organovorans]|uniref:Protoheme IX farnesyltransferase n=1 Tax=Ferroacidibacillus organovorans TaxID=1765683 RepID=A0A117SX44_9BACL|nr:heme o synthase [Ferroacidibacillus organovorans]KUO94741.1 hypothetical protein ATW55_09985 [Ferroacidibacillus organovorans]